LAWGFSRRGDEGEAASGRVRFLFGLTAWSNEHFGDTLYPPKTPAEEALRRYSSLFPVVGVDQLYHRLPGRKLLTEWVERTPDGFLFLPKMWKKVTHEDHDVGDAKTWLGLLDPLREAKRLGPVLLQFPPQLKREKGWDLVQKLLDLEPPGTFALEVRNPTWFVDETQELLKQHKAILVWGTHPKAPTPPWATSDVGFIRFTGTFTDHTNTGTYVKQIDRTPDILEVANRAKDAPWKECFVIVTNPFEGNAVDSLPRIAAALGDSEMAKRSTLKPGEVIFPDKGPKQASLF
jgi:uncharacterized protein YecE (DUF72 family)